MREAQVSGLNQQYVSMVVSIDQVDPDTIHPIKKYEIGKRLAGLAFAQVYDLGAYAFSPIVSNVKFNSSTARVVFQNAYRGLKTSDGKPVFGFEVKDESGVWHEAEAKIMTPAIIATSPDVETVTGVRYCWKDNPRGNLVNSAGLPASPFQR
jgi:sialate O-acetylesterase